jgi:hypothetical protein
MNHSEAVKKLIPVTLCSRGRAAFRNFKNPGHLSLETSSGGKAVVLKAILTP